MYTRKAVIHDMEEKLRVALQEREAFKNQCQQLLQERDDSEIEIENILKKNTDLKSQLAQLHTQNMDLQAEIEDYQQRISNIQECSDTYEVTLKRMSALEEELSEANAAKNKLESIRSSEQVASTLCLYDQRVGKQPVLKCDQPTIITIDLTGSDSFRNVSVKDTSHNKLKKLIKINKFMTKLGKSIKKIKRKRCLRNKYNSYRRERLDLLLQLHQCQLDLDISQTLHKVDTERLQQELLQKEKSINDIYHRYIHSQQQLSIHLQKACDLVDLVTLNSKRTLDDIDTLSCSSVKHSQQHSHTTPTASLGTQQTKFINYKPSSKTIMISDRLGIGFGQILHNKLNNSIVNYCYHDIKLSKIIENVRHIKSTNETNIILLIGNSLGLRKKDISESVEKLLGMKFCKLILCALPYSDSLTESENRHIHSLNNYIHLLTTCHRDKLLFFDTNKFISNFTLTRECMLLSQKNKNTIATLLAYNINTVISTITPTRIGDESELLSYSNNSVINTIPSSDTVTHNVTPNFLRNLNL